MTQDPELRFTSGGTPVTTVTIAVNSRVKDGDSWKDAETSYYRVTVWREYAEHVADSLATGTHVLVIGTMRARTFETQEGEKRTSFDVTAEEIGPSLRWATAKVTRTTKSSQPTGDRPTPGGEYNDVPSG